jgi:hypothetical protein
MDDQMEPIRAGDTLSAARPAPSWVLVLSAMLVAFAVSGRQSSAPILAAGDRAPGQPRPGEQTQTSSQIPEPGSKNLLLRVFRGISEDRIMLIAAGVTYYVILALFPGIAAIISIYGLFADPSSIAAIGCYDLPVSVIAPRFLRKRVSTTRLQLRWDQSDPPHDLRQNGHGLVNPGCAQP